MSDSQIVKNMIAYVEKTEKAIQAAKLESTSKIKTKAVGDILKELEREIKNADQKH